MKPQNEDCYLSQISEKTIVGAMIVGAMIVGAMIVGAVIVGAKIVRAMRLLYSHYHDNFTHLVTKV